MSDEHNSGDRPLDAKRERPRVDLYDPWQRQFTSDNKQNEFRKALETSPLTGS